MNPGIFHLASEVISKAEELSKIYGRPITPGFDVFVTKALIDGIDCNEWTYVKKDGTQFPVKLTVTPIFDELNNLVGFVGSLVVSLVFSLVFSLVVSFAASV